MECLLQNGMVYHEGSLSRADILLRDGRIVAIAPSLPADVMGEVLDLQGLYVFPGFADVHVHLREPGFSYKETIAGGTLAAAAGGFTTVCAMPNLDPVPDDLAHLRQELALIEQDACVHVLPYGAITCGQRGEKLAELAEMAPYVIAFSDDGHGVQDRGLMRSAMLAARACGKMIVAHCEENNLLRGGYIHDGAYARRHGHRGICAESEWRQLARDLDLVAETGCRYHACHLSCRESVALLREAKRAGLDVSGETAPHYLVLSEDDLQENGRFKMNPPLRGQADREALRQAVADGTIMIVATDHAPHAAAEKACGLEKSAMGVVGLETAFPVLYSELVCGGLLSLPQLLALLHDGPAQRFGIGSSLEAGAPADLTVFDLAETYRIDPACFQGLGRATPFAGREVRGRCRLTMVGGRIVYQSEQQ